MKKQKRSYIDVMFTNTCGSENNFKKMCKFHSWKCRRLPKKPGLFGISTPNTVYRIYGNYSMDEILKGHRVFIEHVGLPMHDTNFPNIDNLMQFR
jgi:hypothetical protein